MDARNTLRDRAVDATGRHSGARIGEKNGVAGAGVCVSPRRAVQGIESPAEVSALIHLGGTLVV